MNGDAASRPPAVRCYGGTVAYGYDDEYDNGKDVAPPPVRPGSGTPNQYVYDEHDNDDYKVFPPPGPGTVIESTAHGYTIVPMTVARDDAPPPVYDGCASLRVIETTGQGYTTVPPPVSCYGGVAAYGYHADYDDGTDATPPPVRSGHSTPNQYVYDEYDNDDYKVFPPPGPGTVIGSTAHGYAIVPMPRCFHVNL